MMKTFGAKVRSFDRGHTASAFPLGVCAWLAIACALLRLDVQAQGCAPVTPGLVAWWQAEGNAFDVMGRANGTLAGNATFGTGRVGEGFVLDGDGDAVDLGNPPPLQLQDFTIEAWIKRATVGTHDDLILSYGQTGYGFGLLASGRLFLSKIGESNVQPNAQVADTAWHHVAVSKAGSSVVFYVDGTSFPAPPYDPGFGFVNNLAIGARGDSHASAFGGRLDEVAIYNRALSQAEVSAIFTAGSFGKCFDGKILQQPQSTVAPEGSTVTLSVVATASPPPSYQWRRSGANLTDGGPVVGARTANLTLSNVQLGDAGDYNVLVTSSSFAATSAVAMVQVLPPNAPSIRINGELAVGTTFVLQPPTVSISGGFPGGFIFYTLDRSTPTTGADFYTGGFVLTNDAVIRAMSLSSDFAQTAYAPPVGLVILPTYGLQTAAVGNGSVSVSPPTGPYPSNTVVTLTAQAGVHWAFDHWEGDLSGSANPAALVMGGPRSVQAVFRIAEYPLTVGAAGEGSVTVNGQVIGPATYYPVDAVVTVLATPGADWGFVRWEGTASGTNNPLSLTITGTNSLTAVFGTLPLTVGSPGGGSVTVNGQSIPANQLYPQGSTVLLQANADNGWSFLHWEGAASGTDNPYHLLMNQTNVVQAIFGTVVGRNVAGNGNIQMSTPNPVPCGTALTVTAVPAVGSRFVTWSGAVSGTNPVASLNVTVATPLVGALFTSLPFPSIVGQPTNTSVVVGATAAFGVTATGDAPLRYQWRKAGEPLAGGTNATLLLPAVTPADAGGYDAVVENVHGNRATSAVATLTVLMPATIVGMQGSDGILCVGGSFWLAITAIGTPPLSYQWYHNGEAVAGATATRFTVAAASPDDAGAYQVVVSNSWGSVTGMPALVIVYTPPDIAQGPASLAAAVGSSASLSVVAGGSPPFYYQWLHDGISVPGATSSTLSLNPVRTNHAGSYRVEVSNPCGAITSAVATVTIYEPVAITGQPLAQIAPYGGTATFQVTAVGNPPPGYQWRFSGTNLAGANGASLVITNVGLEALGQYDVVAWNAYSAATSAPAALLMSPSLRGAFVGATLTWGKPGSLTVSAMGSPPLSYQWYKDGGLLTAGTNSTLEFAVVNLSDAGMYSVVISSPWGSVSNAPAQVVVNPANMTLGMYAGVTVEGVPGYTYTIQYSTDLRNTNSWVTATNLTLSQPVELWVDTSVNALGNPKRFYRILAY